jgi:hypothetical protein
MKLTGFRRIVVLAGLWALAVSQPILDALRRAPEFFVAHRADTIDAAVVALALTLAVPLVLGIVVVVVGAVSRTRVEPIMAAFVGALGAILAVQVAYRLGVAGWIGTVFVAIVAAGGSAAAWLRLSGFRTFTLVLSPAALVVPLVFLAGGPLGSSGASQTDQAGAAAVVRATPVVIVVFDELSLVSLLDDAGKLNAARYPNLAALAADGVWFRNATAVSDYTRWALPSIVTGRYPTARSTPTPRDHPDTVFSLVGRSHRLEVSEAVTMLCPRQLCRETETPRVDRESAMAADIAVVAGHVFLPPSARAALPDLTQNWAGFAAADDADDADDGDDEPEKGKPGARIIRATRNWQQRWHGARGTDHVRSAEAFIDGISSDDIQPTLYFMHTLASHRPSRWLPSGQRIAGLRAIPGLTDGKWTDIEWLVAQHHHADIMQAGLADTLVGRLRARLSAHGLYNDALVIVTADHGVSLRPGERARSFSGDNAAEVLSVPLIVKPPESMAAVQRGTTDDGNAETIDVLPTVAHVLGIDVPWAVDGRSLIGNAPPRPRKKFFFNAATMTATFEPNDLWSRRDEATRRQAGIFGLDKWPAFTVPEFRDFVGREVASFGDITSADGVRVTVDGRDALKNVNPKARELPAQLTGRFVQPESAAAAARHVLAVALNGRIVATTRAWPGGPRWMAMLPPDAFRAGPNHVEVFLVDSSRPGRLLRPRP